MGPSNGWPGDCSEAGMPSPTPRSRRSSRPPMTDVRHPLTDVRQAVLVDLEEELDAGQLARAATLPEADLLALHRWARRPL